MSARQSAGFGQIVIGAAKTIPGTATQSIFTVTGGLILLTSLVGLVTKAIGGTATTLSAGSTPTGGSANVTSLATATAITSATVGTLIAVPKTTGALVVANGAVAAGGVLDMGGIAVVPAGVVTVTTSATTTGAITWRLTYLPYDAGVSVTAL